MENKKNNVVITYKFNEFINLLTKHITPQHHSRAYNDRSFCAETWQEAIKNAKYGANLQGEINKITTNMAMLEHVKTKGFGMSDNGLSFDVGSYLSGEPECWIAETFDYKPKKVVKILINTSFAHYINQDNVKNRGAGIISLIQMLKKQGYIVIVNLYQMAGKYTNFLNRFSSLEPDIKYTLFIKIPANPLDIQSLSYALCCPSFCRRLFLAWQEFQEKTFQCNDYGVVQKLDEVAISKDIIHFNGMCSEPCTYETENETKEYILDIFDTFLKLNNEVKNVDKK